MKQPNEITEDRIYFDAALTNEGVLTVPDGSLDWVKAWCKYRGRAVTETGGDFKYFYYYFEPPLSLEEDEEFYNDVNLPLEELRKRAE